MKSIKISFLFTSLVVLNLHAISLNEVMLDTIHTNPNVLSKQKEYQSAFGNLEVAKGDKFLPSVDLRGDVGKTSTDYDSPQSMNRSSTNKNLSITATENLFDGFGTIYNIKEKEYALAATAYTYIEVANVQALESARAYIDVIRNKELMVIEQDSLAQHKLIQKNIRIRSKSGMGVISDLQEIESKVNLAYSNYLAQKKNYKSSQIVLHKAVGRYLDPDSLKTPVIDVSIPKTLQEATVFALKHHPALKVQDYNVDKVKATYKRDQKDLYYPSVDLVVGQSMRDSINDSTITQSKYNQTSGQIQFKWNLFRGFKDQATKQKNISLLQSEYQKRNATKRDVIEEISLAFTAKEIMEKEYGYLQKFQSMSEKKLETSHKEFKVGKKSLLELLAAQGDFNLAKQKLINTKLDLIVARLTLLKALGILSNSIAPDLKRSVGIKESGDFDYGVKIAYDSDLLVKDRDGDRVYKDDDFCDNSKKSNSVQNGCNYRFGLSDINSFKTVISSKPIQKKIDKVEKKELASYVKAKTKVIKKPVYVALNMDLSEVNSMDDLEGIKSFEDLERFEKLEDLQEQEIYTKPKKVRKSRKKIVITTCKKHIKPYKRGIKFYTFDVVDEGTIYSQTEDEIDQIEIGTRITGHYDRDGWIRVSGFFEDGKWKRYCNTGYIKATSIKELKRKNHKVKKITKQINLCRVSTSK